MAKSYVKVKAESNKQKTIREWLNDLPLLERQKAFEYEVPRWNEELCNTFREALRVAFMWQGTKQGFDYWAAVYERGI